MSDSSQSISNADEDLDNMEGSDQPFGLEAEQMGNPLIRAAAMTIIEKVPEEVDLDTPLDFYNNSHPNQATRVTAEDLNNLKTEYIAKFNPAEDEMHRTLALIVKGFLPIHMDIEYYEWAAFLPRLLQVDQSTLDKIAMSMTRDQSLMPPLGKPLQHPYDDLGFRTEHFSSKQKKKEKFHYLIFDPPKFHYLIFAHWNARRSNSPVDSPVATCLRRAVLKAAPPILAPATAAASHR